MRKTSPENVVVLCLDEREKFYSETRFTLLCWGGQRVKFSSFSLQGKRLKAVRILVCLLPVFQFYKMVVLFFIL